MSEYKRANAFGTGYLDTNKLFKVKLENKSKKRFFEIAGDEKAMVAFNKLKSTSYRWDKDNSQMIGKDGKDYFAVEITSPEGDRMITTCDYEAYVNLLRDNGISTEGRWKEWGKTKDGNPKQVKVKD